MNTMETIKKGQMKSGKKMSLTLINKNRLTIELKFQLQR